jgi:hypothetical protein
VIETTHTRLDPRHSDITVLLQKQSDQRCMPTWAMVLTMDNEFRNQIEEQSSCLPSDEAREFLQLDACRRAGMPKFRAYGKSRLKAKNFPLPLSRGHALTRIGIVIADSSPYR